MNELGQKSIRSSINIVSEKGGRGFANKITARLLCLIGHLEAFDANPTEFAPPRLDRDGVPKFPSSLYDEEIIEPGKYTNGLFRGPLLVVVSSSPLTYTHPL